jgi:hypothetical protein
MYYETYRDPNFPAGLQPALTGWSLLADFRQLTKSAES